MTTIPDQLTRSSVIMDSDGAKQLMAENVRHFKNKPNVKLFMVVWDDQLGVCVPMTWDADCEGAICSGCREEDEVALFVNRQAARKAIDISTKWNALLKAQGQPYSDDFSGACRKNLRVVPCNTRGKA